MSIRPVHLAGAARASTLSACPRRPRLLAGIGRSHLPARARRARAGRAGEARAALPGLPARQPLEPARRRAAGRERLGGRSCAASASTARCTPTSAPACTRAGRSASRTRPCRARQRRVRVSFEYADESDRGRYPIPRARADRGRAQLRRRPPRDRRGPRPLPAVRAVRGLPAGDGGRRWRAGSGAIWSLRSNRLRPRGLDVGGRRRPADPARPGPLRGGAPRLDRPCAAVHGASAPAGVRLSRPPLRVELRRPDLPPMGLRVRLRGELRHVRLPARRPRSCCAR